MTNDRAFLTAKLNNNLRVYNDRPHPRFGTRRLILDFRTGQADAERLAALLGVNYRRSGNRFRVVLRGTAAEALLGSYLGELTEPRRERAAWALARVNGEAAK
jgi:hypothetical protein